MVRLAAGVAALTLVDLSAGCRAPAPPGRGGASLPAPFAPGLAAVPPCPRCGTPGTYVAADGTERVRTRMRLADGRRPDILLGLGPFALDRSAAASAGE